MLYQIALFSLVLTLPIAMPVHIRHLRFQIRDARVGSQPSARHETRSPARTFDSQHVDDEVQQLVPHVHDGYVQRSDQTLNGEEVVHGVGYETGPAA